MAPEPVLDAAEVVAQFDDPRLEGEFVALPGVGADDAAPGDRNGGDHEHGDQGKDPKLERLEPPKASEGAPGGWVAFHRCAQDAHTRESASPVTF
jgi:hypothetical protein